ncbi:MAG: hypothetical protein HDR09_10555 [Lachnospiraceae bacterium]|nr:hypothetical protein [Lachnospiraceae bacterium]
MKKYIEENFSSVYTHFREFQENEEYSQYWNKCIEAICDEQLLSHIIFCNDVFCIPPVKTFLTYYKDDFIVLTGKSDAELPLFVKKSIGAFWGMVFKYALKYKGQKSVSVSMNEYFKVKTATYFFKVRYKNGVYKGANS